MDQIKPSRAVAQARCEGTISNELYSIVNRKAASAVPAAQGGEISRTIFGLRWVGNRSSKTVIADTG